ncbi:MAG: CotH kinase family protein [Dysgonamonadaceae bacterium]|jgi:hypothetical protein|nr:CotH kinase family protein [Dysgonamonadaceae bacterium]
MKILTIFISIILCTPTILFSQTGKINRLKVENGQTIPLQDGATYSIQTENNNNKKTVNLYKNGKLIAEYPRETRFYPVVMENNNKLPQLYIDTHPDSVIQRDEWLTGATYQLFDGERQLQNGATFTGACDIKGRGNTTWNSYKKPYHIRLESGGKKPLLGMPAQRHWALMANAYDYSWLRNSVAFKISKIFNNIAWTPRSEYVELYINDDYAGVYELTEHVRIDENRVNISKISSENPDGGYLLELVNSLKDELWFRTHHDRNGNYASEDAKDVINVNVKDPDQNLDNVWDIITSGVLAAEEAIYGDNFQDEDTGYRKYFDIPSTVDLYWVNEFTKNPDANHGSLYFYYNPDVKKYIFGPVWDFDLTMGNYSDRNISQPYGIIKRIYWIPRMLEDPWFMSLVKERWTEKSEELRSILNFIDTESEYLREARERDPFFQYFMNNQQEDYQAEIEYLKNFIEERIAWLNDNIEDFQ